MLINLRNMNVFKRRPKISLEVYAETQNGPYNFYHNKEMTTC